MQNIEPDNGPCGCTGRYVSSPSLRHLIAVLERAEEKRKAEEAELKLEPHEQPQRRSGN